MRECISGATMMEIQDHAAFLHNRNSPAHQMDEEPAELFPFVSPSRMSGVAISEEVREDLGYRNVIGQLYHSWVTDWWLLELGALVIAALCLGCIIIVLFVYRNSPIPSRPWGITLNTLLSVLSQVSNLGLMTALIGAFGQQKWLWFRKSRKSLNDFNSFDKASRGPWGSLLLLCSKSKVMHLGSIGAIAMLLLQAFHPFIQQVVTYSSQWEVTQQPTARISRSMAYHEVDALSINHLRRTYAPNEFKAGVYNGLYNNQTSLSENQPSCPSGKCSWPLYSTLAVCAYVADVSQYIQRHTYSSSGFGETEIYMLPSGAILGTGYERMTLRSTAGGFDSLLFQNTTSLIDFYTFFHSNKTGNPTLLESSLQVCAQTLNTSVTNGETQTLELSRVTALGKGGDMQITVPGDNNTYIMGQYSFNSLASFLATVINGSYIVDADETITYETDAIEVLVNTLLVEPYDQEAMVIFLNGLTISMTNSLRKSSSSKELNGTLYNSITYVTVNWLWLALPVILVLVTCLFLLLTIYQNKGRGYEVWKSSAIVPLQVLGKDAREELRQYRKVSEFEQQAEQMQVFLEREQTKWVLKEEGIDENHGESECPLIRDKCVGTPNGRV